MLLAKPKFVEEVRAALTETIGHSFRRGAATTVEIVGIQDYTIQTLGQWKSSAYCQITASSANPDLALSKCNIWRHWRHCHKNG